MKLISEKMVEFGWFELGYWSTQKLKQWAREYEVIKIQFGRMCASLQEIKHPLFLHLPLSARLLVPSLFQTCRLPLCGGWLIVFRVSSTHSRMDWSGLISHSVLWDSCTPGSSAVTPLVTLTCQSFQGFKGSTRARSPFRANEHEDFFQKCNSCVWKESKLTQRGSEKQEDMKRCKHHITWAV